MKLYAFCGPNIRDKKETKCTLSHAIYRVIHKSLEKFGATYLLHLLPEFYQIFNTYCLQQYILTDEFSAQGDQRSDLCPTRNINY